MRRGVRPYMCIMYVYANACMCAKVLLCLCASVFLSVGSEAPPAPPAGSVHNVATQDRLLLLLPELTGSVSLTLTAGVSLADFISFPKDVFCYISAVIKVDLFTSVVLTEGTTTCVTGPIAGNSASNF